MKAEVRKHSLFKEKGRKPHSLKYWRYYWHLVWQIWEQRY